MTITQANTQSSDPMAQLAQGIAAAVDLGVDAGRRPLRVNPMAGGGVESGAPPPRALTSPSGISGPLQLLSLVADHSHKLHEQMLALTTAITGEAPPPKRLRSQPVAGAGLLPSIAHVAHEIEQVQIEMTRLIEHVRGRL